MNITNINDTLSFSVIVEAEKASSNFYGTGFILGKKEYGRMKYFLTTSFTLIESAKIIKFAFVNVLGKLIQFKLNNFHKSCKIESSHDIAMFDIGEEAFNQIGKLSIFRYINSRSIISYSEGEKILETLFIVSNPPISSPFNNDIKSFPIAIDCKNATTIDSSVERGFFVLNFKRYNWLLGSPVFGIFNKKIKLAGMINSLGKMPDGFCSAIEGGEIKLLLAKA